MALTDRELIDAAVSASGQSPKVFAIYVISRDEKTVRRWRKGTSPIPPVARKWLARWLALRPRDRDRFISLFVPADSRQAD